jgi:hypothetical protein
MATTPTNRPQNAPRRSTTGVPAAASAMQTVTADPNKVGLSGDQLLLVEALEEWKSINDWQGVEDERSREDRKFANGDARNAYQWPTKIYAMRSGQDEIPCLTLNAVRGHNDLIINQIAKNDWAPKIRPTGGSASYKGAELYDCLIRRILARSDWPTQRRKVSEHQIDGGIGYVIVETSYVSNKSRNQEISLRTARDPTGVFLDRYCREPDGSDAKHAFEFERMKRGEFNRRYPRWADQVAATPLDTIFINWLSDKEIVLVKYWRKEQKKDELWWWQRNGQETEKLKSDIIKESGNELFNALKFDIEQGYIKGGSREVFDDQVKWYLIAGNVIVDRGEWAGKYIPICRCVGRETIIDNNLNRSGHTRALIDPQRMLNYHASIAVESIASEPKSKWIAPARSIEGQEQFKEHNTKNFAVLTYNDIDDEAPEGLQKIDPPQRLVPPQPSEAHLSAIAAAEHQLMMVSGQWQPQTGEQPMYPESGKAIGARQQQGETVNFHFFDNQNTMERFIGRVLLDLIPKIYDTQRVMQICDNDGKEVGLQIDPNQQEIVKQLQKQKENEIAASIAFNPKIGEYECISDPGAYYATKRQDAWNALSQLFAQSQLLSSIAADIYFKNGDFEGAEELAERCQKEIEATKPYLFGNGPPPAMAAMQQQVQKLGALNNQLMQKLAEAQLRLRGKEELRDIEAFKADTGRMDILIKAVKDLMPTPAMRAQFEHEITLGSHQHAFDLISQANQAMLNGSGDTSGTGAGQ